MHPCNKTQVCPKQKLYDPVKKKDISLWLNFSQLISKSGKGNGKPLQYSCLDNPMDRGAWWITVHGVTKSQMQLNMQLKVTRVSVLRTKAGM